MQFDFNLIPLSTILPTQSIEEFDNLLIKRIAVKILESKGLIFPLLLEEVKINSYKILRGNLEYFASLEAHNIDPDAKAGNYFQYVNAFIIPTESVDSIFKQADLLMSFYGSTKPDEIKVLPTNELNHSDLSETNETPKGIEALALQNNDLFSKIVQLEKTVDSLKATLEEIQSEVKAISSSQRYPDSKVVTVEPNNKSVEETRNQEAENTHVSDILAWFNDINNINEENLVLIFTKANINKTSRTIRKKSKKLIQQRNEGKFDNIDDFNKRVFKLTPDVIAQLTQTITGEARDTNH